MSDQSAPPATWLAPVLRAFIEQHGLHPSLLGPLASLVDECMLRRSELFAPEQLEQLAAQADWEPVRLAQPGLHIAPQEQLKTLEFPPDFDLPMSHGVSPAAQPEPATAGPQGVKLEPLSMAETYDAMHDDVTPLLPVHPLRTLEFPPMMPEAEEESTTSNEGLAAQELFLSATLPRYQRDAQIAVGGMGQIWRVFDGDLNRPIAMKLLQEQYNDEPEILSRFITEAQIIAQLDHPGVIPVYEFGRLTGGQYYYTMKEVRGQTLHEANQSYHEASTSDAWGRSPEGWDLRSLLKVFRRICETVGYAHERGVVHRDLKPENIVLGEYDGVWLLDWGLAKILKPTESDDIDNSPTTHVTQHTRRHSTQPGDILGTPSYMAPEQMLTPHKVDVRCDVYALGAILYELLSGSPPFTGSTAEAVLYQMMIGPPPPPGRSHSLAPEALNVWRCDGPQPEHTTQNPLLPDGLIELCGQAMHRKPELRFADAQEFTAAFDQWLLTFDPTQR